MRCDVYQMFPVSSTSFRLLITSNKKLLGWRPSLVTRATSCSMFRDSIGPLRLIKSVQSTGCCLGGGGDGAPSLFLRHGWQNCSASSVLLGIRTAWLSHIDKAFRSELQDRTLIPPAGGLACSGTSFYSHSATPTWVVVSDIFLFNQYLGIIEPTKIFQVSKPPIGKTMTQPLVSSVVREFAQTDQRIVE